MPNGTGYVAFTRDVTALNKSILGNWFVTPAYKQYPGLEQRRDGQFPARARLRPEHLGGGRNLSGNFGRDLPFDCSCRDVPDAYQSWVSRWGNSLNTNVDNPFYGQLGEATTMGGKQIPLGPRAANLSAAARDRLLQPAARLGLTITRPTCKWSIASRRASACWGTTPSARRCQTGGGMGANRAGMPLCGCGRHRRQPGISAGRTAAGRCLRDRGPSTSLTAA